MEPKELIVNGELWCKYEVDRGVIHIAIIKKSDTFEVDDMEQVCHRMIQVIQNKRFNKMGYLNLDAPN